MIFQQVTGKNAIAWKNPFHFQHQLFSFVGMELALKINHYSIQASAIGNTQCAYWWFVLFDALYFNWYFPNFSFTHWYFPNSINFFFSRKTIETNDLSELNTHTQCALLWSMESIYSFLICLDFFFFCLFTHSFSFSSMKRDETNKFMCNMSAVTLHRWQCILNWIASNDTCKRCTPIELNAKATVADGLAARL